MLKVGQLLKFVSELNPQKTPTRLSFYNFLRGFATPEENLTPALIEMFFRYCMDFPHWASNKVQLGHEVQFLLENFNNFFQQRFDLSQIRFPQNMQIIEIEHSADLIDAVSSYLKTQLLEGDKFRVLPEQNKRLIGVILRADKSLEARTFDKKFTITQGQLEPLRKDLTLYYSPELELSPLHLQKVEVAPSIIAQFRIHKGRTHGLLLRGYVYQHLLELKNTPLAEEPRLLFPVKRIEQFFVDRRSDPYYQEVVSQLERTCALIQQGDEEASKWGMMTLNKAESALENIFQGDKLLNLLIRDLRHAMGDQSPRKILSSSFNTSAMMRLQPLPEADEECLKITPIKGSDLTN